MTKPPALPELPEPVGFRHSLTHTLHETEAEVQLADAESEAEPLFTADQMRAYAIAALQSAQPAKVSDDSLISKDRFYGDDHVQDIAHALAQECEQAELDPNDFVTVNREKLVAIAARVLEKARAILALRPQAVPMTDRVFDLICNAIDEADTLTMEGDYMMDSDDCIAVVRVMQALLHVHRGITQRADGGEVE